MGLHTVLLSSPERSQARQIMNAPPTLFNRSAHRRYRDRAAPRMAEVADILQDAAQRLLDRLDDTTHRFTHALDLGGRGVVAPALRARGIACISADLSARVARLSSGTCVAADEENLPFAPGSFDLIVANLSLHWVNDLPGCLIQLRGALRPDGLLLASVPIRDTLGPLRRALAEAEAALRGGAAPRIAPFPDLQDCAALLQRAGFALPVVDAEDIHLMYQTPAALLRDLRAAGESNALALRERFCPPASLFAHALAHLPTQDGQVPMLLRMAVLTGWAPAPTQPKPLPRGSGQIPLGTALG
jgi:SAM-dependent methyltransferase